MGAGIGITSDIKNCETSKWIYSYSSCKTYFIFEKKNTMGYGWSIAEQKEIAVRVPQRKLDDCMRMEFK